MTLAELRTRLRNLSGVQLDTLLSDADVDAHLNTAYTLVTHAAEWSFRRVEETVDTVADTADVTLADVNTVEHVAADSGTLQRRTVTQIARQPAHRRTPGKPWAWAQVDDATIRLHPTPDAVYTLTVSGWAAPDPLTDDADTPIFDAKFHDVIVYEAAAQILEREGDDPDRATWFRAEVDALLAAMSRRYLTSGDAVILPPDAPLRGERAMPLAGGGGREEAPR